LAFLTPDFEILAFFEHLLPGCQIGHFVANFEHFGHSFSALAMKKRIWPFCKILAICLVIFATVKLSFH